MGFITDFLPGYISHPLAEKWIIIMVSSALLCFIVSEITGNYSQVDKLWSLLPIAYSWLAWSESPSPRLLLMSVLVTLWGLRLSYNFGRKGGYTLIPWKGEEDYRWAVMRNTEFLKGRFRFGLFNLLFISFYQNLLIMLFTVPALLAASFPQQELNVIDAAATFFMIFFLLIETIADNQQYRFQNLKRGAANEPGIYKKSLSDGFLSEGLWALSRHPNFLSEQGIWLSFYFFSVAASGQWVNFSVTGALLLILLFYGSTALTEKLSSSKYPGYEEYKKRVPKLIPIKF